VHAGQLPHQLPPGPVVGEHHVLAPVRDVRGARHGGAVGVPRVQRLEERARRGGGRRHHHAGRAHLQVHDGAVPARQRGKPGVRGRADERERAEDREARRPRREAAAAAAAGGGAEREVEEEAEEGAGEHDGVGAELRELHGGALAAREEETCPKLLPGRARRLKYIRDASLLRTRSKVETVAILFSILKQYTRSFLARNAPTLQLQPRDYINYNYENKLIATE